MIEICADVTASVTSEMDPAGMGIHMRSDEIPSNSMSMIDALARTRLDSHDATIKTNKAQSDANNNKMQAQVDRSDANHAANGETATRIGADMYARFREHDGQISNNAVYAYNHTMASNKEQNKINNGFTNANAQCKSEAKRTKAASAAEMKQVKDDAAARDAERDAERDADKAASAARDAERDAEAAAKEAAMDAEINQMKDEAAATTARVLAVESARKPGEKRPRNAPVDASKKQRVERNITGVEGSYKWAYMCGGTSHRSNDSFATIGDACDSLDAHRNNGARKRHDAGARGAEGPGAARG